MGRHFAKDRLEAPNFRERLRVFLDEVRADLGVRWLAVAEISVEHGVLQPAWSGCSGSETPLIALTLEDMERLGANAPEPKQQVPALAALASAWAAALTVVPLSVT